MKTLRKCEKKKINKIISIHTASTHTHSHTHTHNYTHTQRAVAMKGYARWQGDTQRTPICIFICGKLYTNTNTGTHAQTETQPPHTYTHRHWAHVCVCVQVCTHVQKIIMMAMHHRRTKQTVAATRTQCQGCRVARNPCPQTPFGPLPFLFLFPPTLALLLGVGWRELGSVQGCSHQ